jgi:hypothetical protein
MIEQMLLWLLGLVESSTNETVKPEEIHENFKNADEFNAKIAEMFPTEYQ